MMYDPQTTVDKNLLFRKVDLNSGVNTGIWIFEYCVCIIQNTFCSFLGRKYHGELEMQSTSQIVTWTTRNWTVVKTQNPIEEFWGGA